MKSILIKLLILSSTILLLFSTEVFATEINTVPSSPIFGKLSTAVMQISNWLIGLSTAAALIGITTGQLMIKLSFGNEEQIIKGKSLTKNVIWAYAIVAGSSLILKAIDSFVR